jgi:anthranilate synthase/aminodeoxychorismate synthase-like glutamine amidotransferase
MRPMAVVFVENNDSFSWNVVDRLPFRRDGVRIVAGSDRAAVRSALLDAAAVLIGPGPLDPERAGLVDVVHWAAERRLPTLGICLGHQAIGVAFGAKLIRSSPMHGRRSDVEFAPSRFFPAFEGSHPVMRYHSLALADVVAPLRVIARTRDGLPMAIEHESLPIAGLQFHPDSFGTPRGAEMMASFFRAVL